MTADIMKNKIIPSLWFEAGADDAMRFYASVFPDSEVIQETPVVVTAKLAGVQFIGINGGPAAFKPNPSISFMVICETREEIDAIWEQLEENGNVYMELDSYPWSSYYGWIGDKYGFTWQLYLGKLSDVYNQRMVPTLMFSHTQQGKCEEAVGFYESIFDDFKSHGLMRYEEGEFKGQVVHTQFTLNKFVIGAMDSGVAQDFTFNEAVSLSLMCKDQNEIDHYWSVFTKDGEEAECGWCQDPYAVSWQIVPYNIRELLFDAGNPEKAFEALMKMKKITIKELENA